jgi:hypothetical protein
LSFFVVFVWERCALVFYWAWDLGELGYTKVIRPVMNIP